jgi:hypothetical protein
MSDSTLLSTNYSVARYRQLVADADKSEIGKFVVERFTDRYITPINAAGTKKNGFCTMAVSCLMIEALMSFIKGWLDTKSKSEKAFKKYFGRTDAFETLAQIAGEFYSHVRCGILHQAETTGGWHIRRDGPLFDAQTLTINATRFHRAVEKSLTDYSRELEESDWDVEVWVNFRKKMKRVCENCSA